MLTLIWGVYWLTLRAFWPAMLGGAVIGLLTHRHWALRASAAAGLAFLIGMDRLCTGLSPGLVLTDHLVALLDIWRPQVWVLSWPILTAELAYAGAWFWIGSEGRLGERAYGRALGPALRRLPGRIAAWRKARLEARRTRRQEKLLGGMGLPVSGIPAAGATGGPQIIVVHAPQRGGVAGWFHAAYWMTKIGVVVIGIGWTYFYSGYVLDYAKNWMRATAAEVAHEATDNAKRSLPSWMRGFLDN